MGMTGPEMLQELRDLLNEPVANFWSDAQLYRYLTRAARDLLSAWLRRHTTMYVDVEEFTYPAATTSLNTTISGSSGLSTHVLRMEDVTDPDDPIELEPAESLDHLRELQAAEGSPTHFWTYITTDNSSTVDVLYSVTGLAPRPSEQTSLRAFYTLAADDMELDASTTDSQLMAQHESAIILKAAIRASMQDQNSALTSELRREFAQAEREARLMEMFQQGTPGVHYDYSDF